MWLVFLRGRAEDDGQSGADVALALTNPEIPHITPTATYSAPTTAQSSGLSILEQAYTVSPGETGAYTAQWFGLGTLGGNVGLFVELLPAKVVATAAAESQISTNMTPAVLASQKYTLKSTFTIPNLPGSSAVYYLIPVPAEEVGERCRGSSAPTARVHGRDPGGKGRDAYQLHGDRGDESRSAANRCSRSGGDEVRLGRV